MRKVAKTGSLSRLFSKKIFSVGGYFFHGRNSEKKLLRADIFRKKGVGHFATLRNSHISG